MSNMQSGQDNVISFPQNEKETARIVAPYDPLTPTIFHESWWLDIVTGGSYKFVEVSDKGNVVGRMPYFTKRRMGLEVSMMPMLTHFLGPGIVEGEGHESTRFLRRTRIIRELIGQLPPASVYKYKCHRDITDAIAFQQEKFMTNVQFTYEVAPQPEEVLWKNMRVEKRKKIKQAQGLHTIGEMRDAEEFWQFYDTNMRQRTMKNIYKFDFCRQLVQSCIDRNRGRIYTAIDGRGIVTAAVLCIWDAKTTFYFLSTRTSDAHNGAMSLLTWEGMKDSAARGLVFDFDGLNTSNVVLYITEFGGIISPRYVVTRSTVAGRIALALKEMSDENRYFY